MKLSTLARHSDLILSAFVMTIVATLFVPLPTFLLDLLIALNIALSLTLLVSSLHIGHPLALSSFPSLLLLTTLFRLSLNVSSTRLILGEADAGEVIEAFGTFVVQGSLLVGAVVFLILTLVQLLVVAKGAERVAEVGARFSLDAMPGKQLSIDADLRSGACTQAEGKQRRQILEEESRFYGALDGAMKFVKGDAIAGLIITAINVVGGLIAGITIHGLSPADALRTYTLLSIGDGLVSQLPALLTAVGAGIVVTRVSSTGETRGLAAVLLPQLLGRPRSLGVVAVVLGALALVPGLPVFPFLALAIGAGTGAWWVHRQEPTEGDTDDSMTGAAPEHAFVSDPVDLLVELPEGWPGDWTDELVGEVLPELRARVGTRLGFPIPGVRVRTGAAATGRVVVRVHDVMHVDAAVPDGPLLDMGEEEASLLGFTGSPSFLGPQAYLRLDAADVERAREHGIELVLPPEAIGRLVEHIIQSHASELLRLQIVAGLLDALEARAPALVREVTARASMTRLTEVLRSLLEEGVPIRQLGLILEAIAGVEENDAPAGALLERARRALGAQLAASGMDGGVLQVWVLDPLVEDVLREALLQTPAGPVVALDPATQQALLRALEAELGQAPSRTLLTSADLRRYLWRLSSATCGPVTVLSYEELPKDAKIQPLGRIEIPNLDPVALAS